MKSLICNSLTCYQEDRLPIHCLSDWNRQDYTVRSNQNRLIPLIRFYVALSIIIWVKVFLRAEQNGTKKVALIWFVPISALFSIQIFRLRLAKRSL